VWLALRWDQVVAACAAEGRPVILVLKEWESFDAGPLLP
jgi:hypothetical protein